MKDFLRETEMDGLGDACKLRAIGFAEWISNSMLRWGKGDSWYYNNGNLAFNDTKAMYTGYLKYLENETSTIP